MEVSGTLKDVSRDWNSNRYIVSFEINEPVTQEMIDGIKDSKLSIKAVKYREKRTLTANAYYWQLLTKVAEALEISKTYAHNKFLRRYGQYEVFDGKIAYLVLPDTEETETKVDESEAYHLKPTSQVKEGKDGIMYRTYMMLKGSSNFDTKEMAVLIDGVVQEAKVLGIETLTPEKLEELKRLGSVKIG